MMSPLPGGRSTPGACRPAVCVAAVGAAVRRGRAGQSRRGSIHRRRHRDARRACDRCCDRLGLRHVRSRCDGRASADAERRAEAATTTAAVFASWLRFMSRSSLPPVGSAAPQETLAGSVFNYWNALDATLRFREVKEQTMSARRAPIALALLFVLFGCASGGTGHAATTPLPIVHASDKQDGGKVSLRPGQKLRLVLHSTYWELKAVSARPCSVASARRSSTRSPAACPARVAAPSRSPTSRRPSARRSSPPRGRAAARRWAAPATRGGSR